MMTVVGVGVAEEGKRREHCEGGSLVRGFAREGRGRRGSRAWPVLVSWQLL